MRLRSPGDRASRRAMSRPMPLRGLGSDSDASASVTLSPFRAARRQARAERGEHPQESRRARIDL
jgi:hypothetical protein